MVEETTDLKTALLPKVVSDRLRGIHTDLNELDGVRNESFTAAEDGRDFLIMVIPLFQALPEISEPYCPPPRAVKKRFFAQHKRSFQARSPLPSP
jgi:hypothetical protein